MEDDRDIIVLQKLPERCSLKVPGIILRYYNLWKGVDYVLMFACARYLESIHGIMINNAKWEDKGKNHYPKYHIGNRGIADYKNNMYMETYFSSIGYPKSCSPKCIP